MFLKSNSSVRRRSYPVGQHVAHVRLYLRPLHHHHAVLLGKVGVVYLKVEAPVLRENYAVHLVSLLADDVYPLEIAFHSAAGVVGLLGVDVHVYVHFCWTSTNGS